MKRWIETSYFLLHPGSNLVLRVWLAEFCGRETHAISEHEFHAEEGRHPSTLDRTIVRQNRTFPSVINTDGKIWIAVSQTHSSSVIVWEAIQGKGVMALTLDIDKQSLSCLELCHSHLDWSEAWGKEVTWGLFIKYVTRFWISTLPGAHRPSENYSFRKWYLPLLCTVSSDIFCYVLFSFCFII